MTEQEIQRGLDLLGLGEHNTQSPPPVTIFVPVPPVENGTDYVIRLSNNTSGGRTRKD